MMSPLRLAATRRSWSTTGPASSAAASTASRGSGRFSSTCSRSRCCSASPRGRRSGSPCWRCPSWRARCSHWPRACTSTSTSAGRSVIRWSFPSITILCAFAFAHLMIVGLFSELVVRMGDFKETEARSPRRPQESRIMRQRRCAARPGRFGRGPGGRAPWRPAQLHAEFAAELARLGKTAEFIFVVDDQLREVVPALRELQERASQEVVDHPARRPVRRLGGADHRPRPGPRRAHRHPRLLLPGRAERARPRSPGPRRRRRPGGRPAPSAHRLRGSTACSRGCSTASSTGSPAPTSTTSAAASR